MLESAANAPPFESLAPLYDHVYAAAGKDYAREAMLVAALARQHAPGSSSLLDVGCGTGGHLRHWQDQFTCVGVDRCEAMLAVARTAAPRAELISADMTCLRLDRRFDIVTCMFASLAYLPTPDASLTAIRCMAAHLAPGGLMIIEPGVFREDLTPPMPGELQFDLGETRVTRHTFARIDDDRLEITFRFEIEHRRMPATRFCEVHAMQLLPRAEFERFLAVAQLRFEAAPIGGRNQYRYVCRRMP